MDPLLLVLAVPFPFVLVTAAAGAMPIFPGGGGIGKSSADSAGGLEYMSMLLDLLLRTDVEKPYLLSPP